MKILRFSKVKMSILYYSNSDNLCFENVKMPEISNRFLISFSNYTSVNLHKYIIKVIKYVKDDALAFNAVGDYGQSRFSYFNLRQQYGEILLEGSKYGLIKDSETIEDIASKYIWE